MSENIQKQNVNYYDAEAGVYDSIRYSDKAGQRAHSFHIRILAELLCADLSSESSVLEVGCGTGRFLPYLARQAKAVEGLDVSPRMIEVAEQRVKEDKCQNVNCAVYDGQAFPFDDGIFDSVYAILVINLIPDYVGTFREVARVLRPGGTFLFNVPNLAGIYCLAGLYVNLRGKTRTANKAGHRYSHWFLPSEWRSALDECGMKVETIRGEPPHIRMFDNSSPLNAQGPGLLFSKSVFIKARRA